MRAADRHYEAKLGGPWFGPVCDNCGGDGESKGAECWVCAGSGEKPARGKGHARAGDRYTGPQLAIYAHLLRSPEPVSRECSAIGTASAKPDPLRLMRDARCGALEAKRRNGGRNATWLPRHHWDYAPARTVAMKRSPIPGPKPLSARSDA